MRQILCAHKSIRVTLFIVLSLLAIAGLLINTGLLFASMSMPQFKEQAWYLTWPPGAIGISCFLLAWWVAATTEGK